MVCAPIRSIIPSLKLGTGAQTVLYLSLNISSGSQEMPGYENAWVLLRFTQIIKPNVPNDYFYAHSLITERGCIAGKSLKKNCAIHVKS